MNYRDFYKNKKATGKDIQSLIPEGVDSKEFKRAIAIENKSVNDIYTSAKIASKNLSEDVNYYKKLHEEIGEEEDAIEGDIDTAETDFNGDVADDYDDNGGLPKVGGALAVPHVGQPIMMGKIIQVGGEFGKGPASGEQSGMTNCAGVNKDTGGVKVTPVNDKEPITAGGKQVDSSIASKSVGGSVVPGEGQKQGGPNSQGTIAATAKLNENKRKLRGIVKEVLKEIKYDKASGKWVKINEETVNMKMGASYKTVQPRQYKVMDDDTARTNQYEPEITEMYDDEEECMMNERYVELANQQRNLSEAELAELKTLREKIDHVNAIRKNYGASHGGTEPSLYEKDDKWIQKAVNPEHKGYCTPMSKPTCTPARKALAKRFKKGLEEDGMEHPDDARERQEFQRGIDKYNRRNPQRFECPTCKTPNALSADQKRKGYQCDRCADSEEGAFQENVNMKMGPSYKTVQPRMYKVSDDDVARNNQYQPDMSETASEIDVTMDAEEGMNEAGSGDVQHSSYRTVKNGNLPQDPKTRWENDVTEGQSKVSKTIAKGQKGKKSTFSQSLKHQKPKKTTSGVHKRKP